MRQAYSTGTGGISRRKRLNMKSSAQLRYSASTQSTASRVNSAMARRASSAS